MKKIFINIFINILILSSLPTLANEVDFTPQWSNIAPAEYSKDIQYIENNTFDKKHPCLSVVTAMTLVGVPVVVASRNRSEKIETNNYWYGRKNEFNEQINICKQMKNSDNKMACYNNVVQAEHSKTAQRQQLQMQQRANAINTYNSIQLQKSINNLNKPATYMKTGNFIYKY